jgi:hypothetical protein
MKKEYSPELVHTPPFSDTSGDHSQWSINRSFQL